MKLASKPSFIPLHSLSWGVLCLCLILSTGCRLGNNEEEPPTPADQRSYSGFYGTAADSMEYCAEFYTDSTQTAASNECAAVSTSEVPKGYRDVMTDPVDFVVTNSRYDGDWFAALLRNINDPNKAFVTLINGKGELSVGFKDANYRYVAFDDPACIEQKYEYQVGKIESSKARLLIDMSMDFRYEGECDSSLEAMWGCYNDLSKCPTDKEQGWDQQYFQNIVKQVWQRHIDLGLVNDQTAPLLRSVYLTVHYR